MKTKILFTTLFLALLSSSCIKDKGYKTYTISRPEYSVKSGVKEGAKLQEPQALKNPGSFVLYNTTMYINEKNKGIHVIDYRNPTSPVNKGFVPIPGNLGISLNNGVLYADCYCDLFVFKLLADQTIQFQNSVPNTFLTRMQTFNYDTNYVTLNWIKKDTTVSVDDYMRIHNYGTNSDGIQHFSANANSNNNPPRGTSVGSSMAVFTIVNDHLYTVDNSNLHAFSLADALHPTLESKQHVNWNVETIFPFKNKLFIGSMSGMYIFSTDNPSQPTYISQFNHVTVCDPVIADERFAFVTLRSGNSCGGFTNQMDVLNIETITNPVLVKSFPFTNPHGLSKDGNVLFVCDGQAGLKIVDATDINALTLKQTLPVGKAIDVIAYKQLAFVMLENAIQIYSYDQQFNVQLLSTINKN